MYHSSSSLFHSSYLFFSPLPASALLAAHTESTQPSRWTSHPLHCLYKACPDLYKPHLSPPSCVFHSTYCPLHEIIWYRAKSTELGVWGPEFKFWLYYLLALWTWVSHFSCWPSVSSVMRVVKKTDEMVPSAGSGIKLLLWPSLCPFASLPQNGGHFWQPGGLGAGFQCYNRRNIAAKQSLEEEALIGLKSLACMPPIYTPWIHFLSLNIRIFFYLGNISSSWWPSELNLEFFSWYAECFGAWPLPTSMPHATAQLLL